MNTVAEEASQERADLVIVGRGVISESFGRLRTHLRRRSAFALPQC
jgi:hypothetical protein